MIDQLVNFVIRPPRADYSPAHDLLEREFVLKGRKYERCDLELTNSRGNVLQCSHYRPHSLPQATSLPCVIYCHGNSGCRADANEAAIILLPSNITLFTLDFAGSGLSDGKYVSLGWHEVEDLKAAVSHLRADAQVSMIGVWGRSMGAVTSLFYGAQDPSIAGMVLDSPFSNLFDLMLELVDVYKIRLPKFTVKVAVQYMRSIIQKRAQFDIMDLDVIKVAQRSFIPVLLGHANDDQFIRPHHSELIYKAYAGDKNIVKFEGDHNTARPHFYYDSVTIFFYNVLHPPTEPVAAVVEPADPLCSLSFEDGLDESFLYQMMGSRPRRQGVEALGDAMASSTGQNTEPSRSRSSWRMSRTVVPCDIDERSDEDIAELMTAYDDSTSPLEDESGSRSWSERFQMSPSSSDCCFAQFPSTEDDEEAMVMQAIAASLGDVTIQHQKQQQQQQQQQQEKEEQAEVQQETSSVASDSSGRRGQGWRAGLLGRIGMKRKPS